MSSVEPLHAGQAGLRAYRLALAAVSVFLCIPILLVRYPPLADYPNHLARAYVLHVYDAVPAFHGAYELSFAPIPNIAMDAILLALQTVLPTEVAGRVFLLAVVLLFVLGCHLLGRAIHGRPTWLALPCCFLVYTATFFWGFVNYVFGVTLFCISFALWLEWSRAWSVKRMLSIALLVFAAYLAHLTAYAFLGIACGLITLDSLRRRRIHIRVAIVSMLPVCLPILAFLAFMQDGGQMGIIVANTAAGKLAGLLAPVLSYNRTADVVYAVALLAVGTLLVRGKVRARVPTLIVGLAFLVIFAVAPLTLLTASAVDTRFVLPGVILVVLSLNVESGPRARALLAFTLALSAARLTLVFVTWLTLSARTAVQVGALREIDHGARVLPWFVTPQPDPSHTRALASIVHYATIDRDAFLPSLFAFSGQQPLVRRDPAAYVRGTVSNAWRPDSRLQDFDYLWTYGVQDTVLDALPVQCSRPAAAEGFRLCRIERTRDFK